MTAETQELVDTFDIEGGGTIERIWMVPGDWDIAVATSELMKQYDVAIWAHHGMFAFGEDALFAVGTISSLTFLLLGFSAGYGVSDSVWVFSF